MSAEKSKKSELLECLSGANPMNRDEFAHVIDLAMRELGMGEGDMAREFSAARPVVVRWLSGKSAPGSDARRAIYARLRRMAEAKASLTA